MPIRFFRKKIKVNINGETVDKYVASMERGEVITIDEVAEMVQDRSSLTRGDLKNSFTQMLDVVIYLVTCGHKVSLGDLGGLLPEINAKACDTPEEVTADTITRFYALFKPSVELTDRLNQVEFHLKDDKVVEVRYKDKKE
ncbi:MAG: hypothetical protein GX670_05030 [Bacteroidales bacterium]|nr:hypothetical protein [Bacteroidales bacterium]